jgi:hypothetical protein
MPTTAHLVSGPSGVGLGAVLLNGVDDYIEIAASDDFAVQTWSWELELLPDSAMSTGGGLLRGPNGGWTVTYDPANDRLQLILNLVTSGLVTLSTPNGSVLPDVWSRALFTRDVLGSTKIHVDRTEAATLTNANAIAYTPTTLMRFGSDGSTYFKGRLGYVRQSNVVRASRYRDRAYYFMWRNPLEFARDLIEDEGGRTADAASFDAEAAYLDGLESRGLKLDGYVTDETELREVLDQIAQFRGMDFQRASGSSDIAVAVMKPLTTAQGTYEVGGRYKNAEFRDRQVRDLDEEVKTQPFQYRVARDENGAFKEFLFKVSGDVATLGKEEDPIKLPLVYDHVTADIIRDFTCKLMAVRGERLALTLNHEARGLRVGEAIQASVAFKGITSREWLVMRVLHLLRLVDVDLVPYDPDVFTYTPGTLPSRDQPIDSPAAIDVGGNPSITASVLRFLTQAQTDELQSVRLSLNLQTYSPLVIDGNGSAPPGGYIDFGTVVGAATRYQAIQADDGDASYIEQASAAAAASLFTLAPPAVAAGNLAAVRVGAIIKWPAVATHDFTTGPAVLTYGRFFALGNLGTAILEPRPGGYAAAVVEMTLNPHTGLPWTAAEIADMEIGVVAKGGGGLKRVTHVGADVLVKHERPADFSYVKGWRIGPSDTQPDPPDDDLPPFFVGTTLVGMLDAVPNDGSYWYWFRVFDGLDRSRALIGPAVISTFGVAPL